MARKLNLLFITIIVILTSCTPSPIPKDVTEQYNKNHYPIHYDKSITAGKPSLWVDNVASANYFTDSKARFINDIITIKIEESTSALQKADTAADRSNEVGMGISSLFGWETSGMPKFNSNIDPSSLVSASSSNAFTGSGSTSRSGTLSSTLTVKVVDVLPNGNLVVAGEKAIRVNGEFQAVKITGLINPLFIEKDNVVSSTRVADLRVEFNGVGIMTETQKPGWLARFMSVVWPF